MSKRSRFKIKVQVQKIYGISMSIPDDIPIPTREQEDDSVAVLICPICRATRYANQRFLDFMEEAKSVHEAIEAALPKHTPCNVIMHLKMLPAETDSDAKET